MGSVAPTSIFIPLRRHHSTPGESQGFACAISALVRTVPGVNCSVAAMALPAAMPASAVARSQFFLMCLPPSRSSALLEGELIDCLTSQLMCVRQEGIDVCAVDA